MAALQPPSTGQDSGRIARWQSPTAVFWGSLVIAAVCVAILVAGGRYFGAVAFGGVNLLGAAFWILLGPRVETVIRQQTAVQAGTGWLVSLVFACGITILYWHEWRLTASVSLAIVMTVFLLGVWIVASESDRPE